MQTSRRTVEVLFSLFQSVHCPISNIVPASAVMAASFIYSNDRKCNVPVNASAFPGFNATRTYARLAVNAPGDGSVTRRFPSPT